MMLIEIHDELSIGDEVYSLNCFGIDYILYPSDDKIEKGIISKLTLEMDKEGISILQYHITFKRGVISFFPVNIGTFFFKTEEELKEEFKRRREEHRKSR